MTRGTRAAAALLAPRRALCLVATLLLPSAVLAEWDPYGYPHVEGFKSPCFHITVKNGEFTGELCLPYVYLAGLPKAGTSALWVKLGNNTLFDRRPGKEYCLPPGRLTAEDLVQWGSKFPPAEYLGADRLLMSGCVDMFKEHGEGRYFDVLMNELGVTDFKVIVIIRDYAELAWASYHYWCKAEWGDRDCDVDTGAHRQPWHERSPQHFDELLRAGVLDRVDGRPFATMEDDWLRPLEARVGDRLLVLAQHELLENPGAVLRRIEEHLGVPPHSYPEDLLKSVVNHSSNHGARAVDHGAHKPGHYDGMAPMLQATRAELDKQWLTDCKYLKERWGLCFPSCCFEKHSRHHH